LLDVGQVFHWHGTGLPTGEEFFQPWHDLLKRGVAHDDERGVVRLEPGIVKLTQVSGRQFANRCLRAGATQRITVRVSVAIQQFREHPQRHSERLGFFLLNPGE